MTYDPLAERNFRRENSGNAIIRLCNKIMLQCSTKAHPCKSPKLTLSSTFTQSPARPAQPQVTKKNTHHQRFQVVEPNEPYLVVYSYYSSKTLSTGPLQNPKLYYLLYSSSIVGQEEDSSPPNGFRSWGPMLTDFMESLKKLFMLGAPATW